MDYMRAYKLEKQIRSTIQKASRTQQKAQERAKRCWSDKDAAEIIEAAERDSAALLSEALDLIQEKAEAMAEIFTILFQLPIDEADRHVMLCRYYCGMKYADAEKRTGLCRRELWRIIKRVEQQLQQAAESS